MPLSPSVYAEMLGKRIDSTRARVYLVNTGWQGGAYGTGYRISLAVTRSLVAAALSGDLDSGGYEHDERLNVDIPLDCPGVTPAVLDPRHTWTTPEAYDEAAERLAAMFEEHASERYPRPRPGCARRRPAPARLIACNTCAPSVWRGASMRQRKVYLKWRRHRHRPAGQRRDLEHPQRRGGLLGRGRARASRHRKLADD